MNKGMRQLKRGLKLKIFSYMCFEDFQKTGIFDRNVFNFLSLKNSYRLKKMVLIYLFTNFNKNFHYSEGVFDLISLKATNTSEILYNILHSTPSLLPSLGYKTDGGCANRKSHFSLVFSDDDACYKPRVKESCFNIYAALIIEFIGSMDDSYIFEKKCTMKMLLELQIPQSIELLEFHYEIEQMVSLKGHDMSLLNYDYSSKNLLIDESHLIDEFNHLHKQSLFLINAFYLESHYSSNEAYLMIFIHDERELNNVDIGFLKDFDNVIDIEDFETQIEKYPELKVIQDDRVFPNTYTKEMDTELQKKGGRNLRLLCFIEFYGSECYTILFRDLFHFCKYFVVKFCKRAKHFKMKRVAPIGYIFNMAE